MLVGFFGLGTMAAPTEGGVDALDPIRLIEPQAGVEIRA
jgi:hypothetical protein